MMRSRLAVSLWVAGSLLASLPRAASAIEVAAYTPDPTLLPARQAVEGPLRVAEALSLDALSTLEPARTGAAADLAALAAWNAGANRPMRVGFARSLAAPLALRIDEDTFAGRIGQRVEGGLLARRSNGNWVWGTSIEVAEAKALRLELAEVDLPAGTHLWVYSMGGEPRAFDLRHLRSDGTMLSPTINGDRIYLEVELPEGAAIGGQGFSIRRAHELVTTFGGEAEELRIPEADGCLKNGECYDTADFPGITNARKGIFQFLFEDAGNLYTCSGALIGDNDASTLQPWLLTANHCIGSQASALSMDTFFFFRNAGCAGGATTGTYGPLGADLVVTSEATDVTLARAVDPGDVPVGAVYLGWTSVRPADGTVLHRLSHPVRDLDDTILAQSYSTHQLDETPAFACSGVSTANFLHSLNLDGSGISGGSSGSPVMRSDGIIVGQLLGSCGAPPDGCGTDENILDGAFATSYPLLAPYLSPGAGGVCIRDADTACLLDGKFKVEVDWTTATSAGTGKVMSFGAERAESEESAFFWFFNASNFEMGVKMVDACVDPFNRYWVFFSGLTTQGFRVRVTRMSDGLAKVYPANPINNLPTTVADTDAFTCP